MKFFKTLTILLSSVILLVACNDNSKAKIEEKAAPLPNLDLTIPPNATVQNPNSAEPAQNAAGVWHYTCSQGCAGGAGTASNCTTCGNALAHNQAYHGNTVMPTVSPNITPPVAEPAQNSAGVWHYTCAKGCSGGAGKPENCGVCGDLLAHNTVYHQ